MNPMMRQLVNQKMSQLTPSHLIQLGQQFELKFSQDNAKKIVNIIRTNTIDVFDDGQREALLKQISKQVNPKLAKDIHSLMKQFL